MHKIYTDCATVLSLSPYQDETGEVQVQTTSSTFTIPATQALRIGDEIWTISKTRTAVGGTIIGVVRGKEVLFKNTETCPEAIKFSVLLAMSRSRGFNSLAEDDRIWLMKHNEHARECPDCLGALAGHKELGG